MESKVRIVANDVYIPMLRELVEEGQTVRMTVSGNSMSPLIIHQRDSVLLAAPKDGVKKGDIAFYQRENGAYILHRIVKVQGDQIWCIGDGQQTIEGPLSKEQVFAVVTGICRKDKWIKPGDLTWKFFEVVWLNLIPLRPVMRKMYGLFCTFFNSIFL